MNEITLKNAPEYLYLYLKEREGKNGEVDCVNFTDEDYTILTNDEYSGKADVTFIAFEFLDEWRNEANRAHHELETLKKLHVETKKFLDEWRERALKAESENQTLTIDLEAHKHTIKVVKDLLSGGLAAAKKQE